jgi:hypothetical protein
MWAASFKSLYQKRPPKTMQLRTCVAGRSRYSTRTSQD